MKQCFQICCYSTMPRNEFRAIRKRSTTLSNIGGNIEWLATIVTGKGGYYSYNTSRTTITGIAEYRAALTLDWMAAEDMRQKQLAIAFQTETSAPVQMLASECVSYDKPAPGKVARLMLELLKNLEGDDGRIIPELIQALVRTRLLVETSVLEEEPDFDSLVETPGVMVGAPHDTFPRILALVWMSATDTTSTKKTGWCTVNKITKYLTTTRPAYIASHMRSLDQVLARARFIMEEFIQHVTPNMYERSDTLDKKSRISTRQLTHPLPVQTVPTHIVTRGVPFESRNSMHLENVRSYIRERAEDHDDEAGNVLRLNCCVFLLFAGIGVNFLV